jgi:hypothetical protein
MAKLPGSVWIDGASIRFIDANGIEYYYIGTSVGVVSAVNGSVWQENDLLCYVDAGSEKRYLTGINEGAVSALAGCIWIEASRIKTVSGGGNKFSYHSDSHTDGGHNDHSDAGSPHQDATTGGGHNDVTVPHEDTHDDRAGHQHCDAHGDVGGPSGDHLDTHFDYFCDASQIDDCGLWVYQHADQYLDQAIGHLDVHSDEHCDFVVSTHTDQPYFHGDASGSDTHSDHTDHSDHSDFSHSDVAHVDMPVYVGP